ncbi:hypothetical protein CHCC15290_1723 [Bacillus licheniformis]|nr:hypothetical protein CHCC5026_0814 [Bacillus licheniformis]TWK53482.1 hypothetical protein CHCC20343_3174 [Bacillus licheniformis]TWL94383.1 hypothetical protein CHCC15290_1723 [Bacillus licheniformis]
MCEFFVRTAVQTVNKMLNKQNKLEFFLIFISKNRNFLLSTPVYNVYLISKWVL